MVRRRRRQDAWDDDNGVAAGRRDFPSAVLLESGGVLTMRGCVAVN